MDFMKMMRQAQEMQSKMQALQSEAENIEVTGATAGGQVEVTLTLKGDMKKLKIDPALVKANEADMLEDLIMTAHADARTKAEQAMAEKMKGVTANMNLPAGFKLPF